MITRRRKPEAFSRSKKSIIEQEQDLKDGTIQNWKYNSYHKEWADQFGFIIEVGKQYTLFYREQPVLNFPILSLTAAKTVAAIILNDKILNSNGHTE